MLVRHTGYSYFNPNDNNENEYNENDIDDPNVIFNPTIFQDYINKKEYEAAYKYANNFVLNDPRKQQEFRTQLEIMRSEGRRVSAIYNKLKDSPEKLQAVEFAENIFEDGGLENIGNNEYAKKFSDLKAKLGSTDDTNAASLSLTFHPKKQTLFGQDWLDWAARDNPYTIDAFYERSGLSEQHLKAAGITPHYDKDGGVTIQFDKTNKLANKILANAFSEELFRQDNPKAYYAIAASDNANPITRFGIMNTGVQNMINEYMPTIKGYDAQGQEITSSGSAGFNSFKGFLSKEYFNPNNPILSDLQELIFDASNSRDKTFEEMQLADKVYSSTITGHLDDGWYQLQKDFAEGKIDHTKYRQILADQQKELADFISSIGSATYDIYSNQDNDAINDETLRLMSAEEKGSAFRHISSANGDIIIKGMISNGKMGVLVSVPATPIKDKDVKEGDTADDRTIGRRFQYFIPGLLVDKVQAAVARNTTSRSSLEVNKMQDWGYDYTTAYGETIAPDGTGHFIYSGSDKRLTTEEARRLIDKDMLLQDAKNNLTFNFVNNKNQGFDKDIYEFQIKTLALKAVSELYPETPLVDNRGIPIDVEEIFNAKGVGKSMSAELENKISYSIYDKIMEIYDMYDKLMSNASYYFR